MFINNINHKIKMEKEHHNYNLIAHDVGRDWPYKEVGFFPRGLSSLGTPHHDFF
jgi:hypothetical protein